jgi:hypothetical protein
MAVLVGQIVPGILLPHQRDAKPARMAFDGGFLIEASIKLAKNQTESLIDFSRDLRKILAGIHLANATTSRPSHENCQN